jgi:hypothetical protein
MKKALPYILLAVVGVVLFLAGKSCATDPGIELLLDESKKKTAVLSARVDSLEGLHAKAAGRVLALRDSLMTSDRKRAALASANRRLQNELHTVPRYDTLSSDALARRGIRAYNDFIRAVGTSGSP